MPSSDWNAYTDFYCSLTRLKHTQPGGEFEILSTEANTLVFRRGSVKVSVQLEAPWDYSITTAADAVTRIEPLSWWVGMKTPLQLMINGDDIASYDVTISGGSVTVDGIDVRTVTQSSLRRNIGIIQQDVFMFAGSIRENIRYGRLDATDEECKAAAKLVCADQFIRRLPLGYNTMLNADGSNLSQGERQLLAIARAAIANPPVLILDEATSSIDTRTEVLIEKGMDSLMQGRTVFVIAHRLSTVRNADMILVLEDGKIIESGNHDQLIEQKGKYYRLYTGLNN